MSQKKRRKSEYYVLASLSKAKRTDRPAANTDESQPTIAVSPKVTYNDAGASISRTIPTIETDTDRSTADTTDTDTSVCASGSNHQIKSPHANEIMQSLQLLHDKVDRLIANNEGITEYTDDTNDELTVIRRMSNPKTKDCTNFLRCLEILGFPVDTIDKMNSVEKNLEGAATEAKRKRNALVNALVMSIPEADGKSLNSICRACVLAVAPAKLWQFYSTQGKSGTKRMNAMLVIPNVFKSVVTALTIKTKKDVPTIVTTVGKVLKGCQTRAESKQYVQQLACNAIDSLSEASSQHSEHEE